MGVDTIMRELLLVGRFMSYELHNVFCQREIDRSRLVSLRKRWEEAVNAYYGYKGATWPPQTRSKGKRKKAKVARD